MTRVERYKCDYCGEMFKDYSACLLHEYEHQANANDRARYLASHSMRKNLCDFCEHSYLVYGCEQSCAFLKECNFMNDYQKFAPAGDNV